MVIIAQKIINEFAHNYPLAAEPLDRWYNETEKADWTDLNDIKKTFNTVDFIGNDRFVFDIGGNKYRLIAMIHFSRRTLYIRFIGTHKQYDEIISKKIIDKI